MKYKVAVIEYMRYVSRGYEGYCYSVYGSQKYTLGVDMVMYGSSNIMLIKTEFRVHRDTEVYLYVA